MRRRIAKTYLEEDGQRIWTESFGDLGKVKGEASLEHHQVIDDAESDYEELILVRGGWLPDFGGCIYSPRQQ